MVVERSLGTDVRGDEGIYVVAVVVVVVFVSAGLYPRSESYLSGEFR